MVRLKLLASEPWMVNGLCRQVDPDLWFAEKGDWPSTRKAKNVCRRCPVQQACLQFALDSNEQFGVWGGLTSEERRLYRRFGGRSDELAS